MARFTSIGMGRKKFVASAAEEQSARDAPAAAAGDEAGPSTGSAKGNVGAASEGGDEKKKKKRRGRDRVKDESGKRVAIGEKKGFDDGRKFAKVKEGWGKDEGIARRSKLSAEHAESRRQKRSDQKNANVTCFACRGIGHAARDCPNVLLAAAGGGDDSASALQGQEGEATGAGAKRGLKRKAGKSGGELAGNKCYRCNSNSHSLSACPEPVDPTDPTPFATCYICLGAGHLASLCPSNPGRGIYPKGGSCKVCGSVAHRAKDCPDDKRGAANANEEEGEGEGEGRRRRGEVVLGVGSGAGADEDDFMVVSREDLKSSVKDGGKKKKHLPARNGERPMKRLREAGAEDGPTNRFAEVEKQHAESQDQEAEVWSVPLTARKPVQGGKAKAKVVAF